MEGFDLKFSTLGRDLLLMEWPQNISEDILVEMLSFKNFLKGRLGGQEHEITNTYNTLAIFAPGTDLTKMTETVKEAYHDFKPSSQTPSTLWEIPVCYDEEFGTDLKKISQLSGLEVEEIISRHVSAVYRVYFIGFLPGFLYLGGMDQSLATPRRETPRPRVPQGAVGIAGSQTGIYPQQSPAGWNIIGNCPIPLFDPESTPPCFAKAGDTIRFKAVSKPEYQKILRQVKEGSYTVKSKQDG